MGSIWRLWERVTILRRQYFRFSESGTSPHIVYVDSVFARVQEATLLLAVTLGSLLLWVTMSRQTGLRSDTKGLAAIASVATPHPFFLNELSQIN